MNKVDLNSAAVTSLLVKVLVMSAQLVRESERISIGKSSRGFSANIFFTVRGFCIIGCIKGSNKGRVFLMVLILLLTSAIGRL